MSAEGVAMIITDRKQGIHEVECDECPSESETFEIDDGWQTMIDQLMADGWQIFKDENGKWTHIGPAHSVVSTNPFDFN